MTNQIPTLFGQELTMSSRDIAELVESRHDNVKRSMETMRDLGVITFTQSEEKTGGRPAIIYHVSKRDSYVVVAQLSPEFTARLVDRWQELEKHAAGVQKLPTTFAEALRLAAEQAERIEQQARALTEAAPKVEFVDRYVAADTGSKGFRQVAKLLKANEREFRAFLSEQKILYRLGGEWMPFQCHVDAGRFEVKAGVAGEHAFNQAKFTAKGVKWVAGLWAQHNLGDLK